MKELVILSGKGGTGKTSISAAFAHLAPSRILVDADVDAANLHLVVPHKVFSSEPFSGGILPELDPTLCTDCGTCVEVCAFHAIKDAHPPEIDPVYCEGCGICHDFCPAGAIGLKPRISGTWFHSSTAEGPMLHAHLGIAEENSGKLVSMLRKRAGELGRQGGYPLILVDGPPGIGCPVIASLTGADLVLMVTEPTLSGRHDMLRLAKLCARMRIPVCLTLNKWDLNPEMTHTMEEEARNRGIEILTSIPFDTEMAKAMAAGRSLTEISSGPASQALMQLWQEVLGLLEKQQKSSDGGLLIMESLKQETIP
ncbi:MinD superfamily P-loop ATPase [Desulfobotulus alkaliphilus]|uniref:MinD superfamily P-loop ATPase n=1 Tax=Desulfobotulus alkaliphilus TaxID=622671 RepID=A0A562RHG6_9BACT|nr:ATP-binding protein [Desulfobotulus alkaliphilus]TWI67800.1 MinD superfamily P-loop ATPase [Desulfobotulus alkaliphilus]